MNRIFLATVIVCGLWMADLPDAAAHDRGHKSHKFQHYDGYYRDAYRRDRYRKDYRGGYYKRVKKMPRWLKRDRAFRHWYERSRLRRHRHISWHELFDIYRWERDHRRYRRY